jgi:hypothetical protein
MVFPIVKPINKVCCNTIKSNHYINLLEVIVHVYVIRIGYGVVLV